MIHCGLNLSGELNFTDGSFGIKTDLQIGAISHVVCVCLDPIRYDSRRLQRIGGICSTPAETIISLWLLVGADITSFVYGTSFVLWSKPNIIVLCEGTGLYKSGDFINDTEGERLNGFYIFGSSKGLPSCLHRPSRCLENGTDGAASPSAESV